MSMDVDRDREGLTWQVGVGDRMSYHARRETGQHLLDGTGTGAVALTAAPLVAPVLGLDISADMLPVARQRAAALDRLDDSALSRYRIVTTCR